MAYDDDTAIVLWPEYFDASLTRKQGRRLPVSKCVKDPSLDMIAKGAIILGLDYKIFEDMAYPSDRLAKKGCVKVEKGKMKKTEIIPKIAEILVKNKG
ncbi:MAG: signal recognition particle subunit SRP19/SEC65 family protein [Methanomethylophilus sp.]|jgi:signal recognition particle subunit SRP19